MFQPHLPEFIFHKVLEYTSGMLDLSELDNWVFDNFHDILASEDAWSIEVAKLIEGSSVEIGEAMTTEEELKSIYSKSREVVEAAIPILRKRMGNATHNKVRDFLKVHNKGGSPCPDCGGKISQITANKRITSYCRGCQPGLLIKN